MKQPRTQRELTKTSEPLKKWLFNHKEFQLEITTSPRGIQKITLPTADDGASQDSSEIHEQLAEYLDGKRESFSVALDIEGTEFRKKVWQTLLKIPYGETRSYSWIAEQIQAPASTRAVGTAVGSNPLPIIIPCHRVIRKDQSLGGFAWGLPIKRRLLAIEGIANS